MSAELKRIKSSVLTVIFLCLLSFPAWGQETAVLTGKIIDVDGHAVEGARVFVYDTPEVRRPADFISAPTDREGIFRMAITPGRYWAMARLKNAEGYGPLMAGDKHSGEAAEIEIGPKQQISTVFTVADLREARRMKSGDREGPVKLSGRILNEKGMPVANAYVIANRTGKIAALPDYLSASTGADGRYALFLPQGIYYLGTATEYPPDRSRMLKGPVSVEADMSDLDIVPSSPGVDQNKN